MISEKRNNLLLKVTGILLLGAGVSFADYIEGIDTTDANGYGLDSALMVTANDINGLKYHLGPGGGAGYFWGLFTYSFDDIKIAATEQLNPYGPPTGFYCSVIKKKDNTYSKVQVLKKLADGRYVFQYGTNTTPNDRMLEKLDYDRSVRYKPNNVYSTFGYMTGIGTLTWEPPLPNNNHLLGYIYYMPKRGVFIDTTAPINPAQWDSIAFSDSTRLTLNPAQSYGYFNLVAVYTEGKSDFLQGWTFRNCLLNGVNWTSSSPNRLLNKIAVKKTDGGFLITLQPYRANTGPLSLAVFNVTGVGVAQIPVIKGNSAIWKTDNLAEGVYLIRAKLPDKSVLTRTMVFTR